MNLQSMLYFKTVAEFQHYTKAADALFITQPALSKAIRNLECELGVSLFTKSGRNVILTEYGHIFYEYVSRAVNEIDEGVAAIHQMAESDQNTMTLSALVSMCSLYLPDQIQHFKTTHPSCRLLIEYKFTSQIISDVLTQKKELGLCSDFDPDEPRLRVLNHVTVYREPIGLIVNKSHPLANCSKVSIEQLKNEKFVEYLRTSYGINKVIKEMCEPYGFEPNIVEEGYSDYGVIGAVMSSQKVAIIPASGFLNISSVAMVPLDTPAPITREINLIWRKDTHLSFMANAFKDLLVQSAAASPS